MSKFSLPRVVILLALLLTTCSSPLNDTEQTKEVSVSEEVMTQDAEVQEDNIAATAGAVSPLDPNQYHVVLELVSEEERATLDLPEGTYSTYLYGEDIFNQEIKLLEMPFSNSMGSEYGISEVFPGETGDIILPFVGQGCGGCVNFTDFYYLVNKYDHSVSQEPFAPPEGLEFSRGGPAEKVAYDEVGHQMAYVFQFGDFYEDPGTYHEEVWVYLFDEKRWRLAETLSNGNTVFCTVFNNLDFLNSKDITFWKGGLNLSPSIIDPVPENMYCNSGY